MKLSQLCLGLLAVLLPAIRSDAQITAEHTPSDPFIGALPGGARFDAQTFTALTGGFLDRVDLALQSIGFAPTAFEVSVLGTSNGVPIGGAQGILGRVELPGSELPGFGSGDYLSVDFRPQNIWLDESAQYAISVGGSSFFVWMGTDGGYSGGSMFTSSNQGQTYALFPTLSGDRDLAFRVLVDVAPVPEGNAAATSILGAICFLGIAACRKRFGRA